MSSLKSEFQEQRVYFDEDCSVCVRLVERYREPLEAASFKFIPLQQNGVSEELGIPKDSLLAEMRVRTSNGKVISGAATVVFLAKQIKSLWPVVAFSKLPFGFSVLNICLVLKKVDTFQGDNKWKEGR